MANRKLPIGGVQTFRDLRRDYDVYVDKTMHIYSIASRSKTVFLARPRRFGKSLLCSTIASLFRGEKALFEGLAISGTGWEWVQHPVIHLDLSAEDYTLTLPMPEGQGILGCIQQSISGSLKPQVERRAIAAS